MGGDSKSNVKRCGFLEPLIFVTAITCGTACSLVSKIMLQQHGTGLDGDRELFEKPIFQTFAMFIAMLIALPMHEIVLLFKLPYPGYTDFFTDKGNHDDSKAAAAGAEPSETTMLLNSTPKLESIESDEEKKEEEEEIATATKSPLPPGRLPLWMWFFMSIPSIFDLTASALCMMGLVFLDVSIYQMLRGSEIIFVSLMKQQVLGDHLFKFQWVGVAWNVLSVILVGSTALLNSASSAEEDEDEEHARRTVTFAQALLGIVLVLLGAFVRSQQFVFEEKVMKMEESAVPPLLLIGIEGLWGTILTLFIVYPLVYYLPGNDHGRFEDPFNTWHMIKSAPAIQWSILVYLLVILGYNVFAVLVTFLLNSIWHSILDNFRPISIWITDMLIFYFLTNHAFGEPWTVYSWMQLAGMFVLLYGTAVYNAPNGGSIALKGKWYHLFIDMSSEYDQIALEEKLEAAKTAGILIEDRGWEERMEEFKVKKHSSLGERSPHISVHTQALRSLGSPKI